MGQHQAHSHPVTTASKSLIIALDSLCAEGTPVLTLELCRWWLTQNINPTLVVLKAKPDDLKPEFQQLGIPIKTLNLPTRGYWRYGQMIREFYRICCQSQADALLSMPLGWHSFMAYGARLAGVHRVAAHVGNYPPYWIGSNFHKFRLQVQLGRPVTHKLICCSHYVRQGVIQHFGIPPEETLAIYNGCPIERFTSHTRPSQSLIPNPPVKVGMIARLEAHKDQPTLIRASKRLKDQGLKVQIQLIGDGSRRSEYEELIRAEGVEDCVQLLGMRRDIPELLANMDIFVFSAKPDEGLGVALVEAMAAGVPIIATDVGACREVLEDGDLGLLVPPQDPQKMADAVFHLLQHPQARNLRAQKARKKAMQSFTTEKMAHAYAVCLGLGATS